MLPSAAPADLALPASGLWAERVAMADTVIIPLKDDILDAIAAAQAAKEQLAVAEDVLKTKLQMVLRALLKPGMIIKRRQRGNPSWLAQVKTLRGNDRGTNTFQIASDLDINLDVTCPDLSSWSCEATPISEKTGNPMNGSAHGADANRPTVRLVGCICNNFGDEANPNESLLKVVAAAAQVISG